MRLVFLSVLLLGATCNGGEAPLPDPSLATAAPDDVEPEDPAADPATDPAPPQGTSESETEPTPEGTTPEAPQPKGGADTDQLEQRFERQLDEADEVLRVLREDAPTGE